MRQLLERRATLRVRVVPEIDAVDVKHIAAHKRQAGLLGALLGRAWKSSEKLLRVHTQADKSLRWHRHER
jgi:hypothetical protein